MRQKIASRLYCLDSSALLNSWTRHYRMSSFGLIWSRIAGEIEKGTLISVEPVLEELRCTSAELAGWLEQRSGLFLPMTPELQLRQRAIVNTYRNIVDLRKHWASCDAWVIAAAQLHRCPVVTEETPLQVWVQPRIPDVCRNAGVPWMRMADLIDALGLNQTG